MAILTLFIFYNIADNQGTQNLNLAFQVNYLNIEFINSRLGHIYNITYTNYLTIPYCFFLIIANRRILFYTQIDIRFYLFRHIRAFT